MPKAYCFAGNHFPKVVLAFAYESDDETGALARLEDDVQLTNDGTPNGLYGDGTAGVPEAYLARVDTDTVVCPEHGGVCEWRHN